MATTTSKKPDVKAEKPAVDDSPVTVVPDADATPNTYHEHAAANGCVGG